MLLVVYYGESAVAIYTKPRGIKATYIVSGDRRRLVKKIIPQATKTKLGGGL